ncbi:hypothetical protein [Campylobacter lanienae]|nr:hypothetical protein [Campylobacter lanienae]
MAPNFAKKRDIITLKIHLVRAAATATTTDSFQCCVVVWLSCDFAN